jgi:hypothetical protein
VPLAGWCGAVRAFARGAEPLAGNCCLVAGQRLSLSGKYSQPVNITGANGTMLGGIRIVGDATRVSDEQMSYRR